MLHRKTLIAAVVVSVLASRAAADPVLHLNTPSTVHTDGGADLRLPPGYFLDESTWQTRDGEFRRLQDQEHRLKAENDSLRKSNNDYPWLATGVVFAFGIATGIFVMTQK